MKDSLSSKLAIEVGRDVSGVKEASWKEEGSVWAWKAGHNPVRGNFVLGGTNMPLQSWRKMPGQAGRSSSCPGQNNTTVLETASAYDLAKEI